MPHDKITLVVATVTGSPRLHGKRAREWILRMILESESPEDDAMLEEDVRQKVSTRILCLKMTQMH